MLKEKSNPTKLTNAHALRTLVLFGDPRLPDVVKLNGQFNPLDFAEVAGLKATLAKIPGYTFEYHDHHETLIQTLMNNKPDFVFNQCDEGFRNQLTQELHISALLDLLDIPYTGAGPNCLALCYDKAAVRGIAKSLNIPVPEEIFVAPSDPIPQVHKFPVIIKPNYGDGSFGITQNGVVYQAEDFASQFSALRQQFPNTPLLVQQFLTGNEYTVPVIGNPGSLEFLPVLHIDYAKLPKNLPPILAHDSKWNAESPYWNQVEFNEAEISASLQMELAKYSAMLFDRLHCRDYARFDFRLDEKGVPHLLEANPNPGLNWLVVEEADAILLAKILQAAKDRYGLGR